ncbi:MAG: N-6 DNA methylase [Methanophagales archaeon]|nr:N-6 DNA methylase [Methanophagales archaeon]
MQDLFKRLYQNLVPKRVRHDLGEYFTPDWIAELVLKEAGYDGDIERRVLDPACGSGTFLVLAIKEAKSYAEEHFITDKRELLWKIVHNIVSIDLNPLAVLASRANYVIALGDLIRYIPKEGVEIPVYLAGLGAGEKDFSMLFTYVAADRYLKNGEKLAFLITQEVFKPKGAGEGFRKFKVKNTHVKVVKAHDLVSVKPFESAANKTALLDRTEKVEMQAKPIGTPVSSWQTFEAKSERILDTLRGKSIYQARRGASIDPYHSFMQSSLYYTPL